MLGFIRQRDSQLGGNGASRCGGSIGFRRDVRGLVPVSLRGNTALRSEFGFGALKEGAGLGDFNRMVCFRNPYRDRFSGIQRCLVSLFRRRAGRNHEAQRDGAGR